MFTHKRKRDNIISISNNDKKRKMFSKSELNNVLLQQKQYLYKEHLRIMEQEKEKHEKEINKLKIQHDKQIQQMRKEVFGYKKTKYCSYIS